MKIFFSQKYLGKDTSELPSSYLVWILEQYADCEYLLREACKKELSQRLSIDFTSTFMDDQKLIHELQVENQRLQEKVDHLNSLLFMSTFCKGNPVILEGYDKSPELLKSQIELIAEVKRQFKNTNP